MDLLGLGVLAQMVADAAIGVRLLWLAGRTRRLPELCMGLTLLGLGAVGLPLSILARSDALADPDVRAALLRFALGAQDVAVLALYVATWKVFRPEARWAAGLACAAGAGFAGSLVGHSANAGSAYWVGFALRAGGFVWSGLESTLYVAKLRRRLALGLADPVILDRFRLWAICCGATVVGFAVFMTALLLGRNPAETPWLLAATSAIGLIAAVALWLAFAPPRAYLARVAKGPRSAKGS
jgi:hypothetical protein